MLRVTPQSKTRRLRVSGQPPRGLDSLPDDWRQLLKRWVRRGGDSRWETLKGDAGVGRQGLAQALLDWQPWQMDIAALQSLPSRSPLNALDQACIAQLQQVPNLPAAFVALLDYMQQHKIKGEQEGIL